MKIGMILRLGPLAVDAPPQPYQGVRAMARCVEAAGLDSIWVYDHLLYRWPGRPTDGIWESWTMLAALAEATQRVELGTLVACTQFRPPALLAKMACTLDEVSGGRLVLGLGAGWHAPEFSAFGYPFDHRVARFEEAVQIIRPLLKEGRGDFRGRYYQLQDCEIVPRGPRASGPPLLLAGAGPRMLGLVARYADWYNTAWHTEPETAVAALQTMRAACAAAGRAPETLGLTVAMAVVFPDLGPSSGPGAEPLVGSPERLARVLEGYQALGVSHLIVDVSPHTPAAVERFAEVVRATR